MLLWFINLRDIINFGSIYYTVLLGRCVMFSVPILLCIYLLRKTIFRHCVFGKVVIWSAFIVLPFLGKLHAYYENPVIVRSTIWWTNLCFEISALNWIYMAGVIGMAVIMFRRKYRLFRMVKNLPTRYIGDVRVHISKEAVTPFAVGLIRHRIVVPEVLLNCLQEEELEVIVLHEKVHIRLGHLWIFEIWNIIRCLLWINPLFVIAVKWLKSDLETCCDTLCMHMSNIDSKAYGRLILKSIQLLQEKKEQRVLYAAFAGEKQFRNLETRFQNIMRYRQIRMYHAVASCILAIVVATTAVIGIKAVSYPRYYEDHHILVTNKDATEILVPDCEEVHSAISIQDNELIINTGRMNAVLKKYNVKDSDFFFMFGGYTKMPGMGGASNGVSVEYKKTRNKLIVPFTNNGWANLLKYM